jgi:hypothetical protein
MILIYLETLSPASHPLLRDAPQLVRSVLIGRPPGPSDSELPSRHPSHDSNSVPIMTRIIESRPGAAARPQPGPPPEPTFIRVCESTISSHTASFLFGLGLLSSSLQVQVPTLS